MDNFNYKRELLLFLYENNYGYVEIYPVSENNTVTDNTIRATIINLKKDLLIDSDAKYVQIGCGDPQNPGTVKSLHVKARITPLGEQYVRDTYMKKDNTHQINAQQIVFASGDITAPISQANDHSSSELNTDTITATNPPTKTKPKNFWDNKYIVATISGVIVVVIGYFIIKYLA